MKVNSKVHFISRNRAGNGTVVKIHPGLRGEFYEVKPDDGSKNVKVRKTQLRPV